MLIQAMQSTQLSPRIEVLTYRHVSPPTSADPMSEAINAKANVPPHLSEDVVVVVEDHC